MTLLWAWFAIPLWKRVVGGLVLGVALGAIWPGRRIEAAILWTAARRLMPLPDALLDEAWGAVLRDLDPGAGGS